MITWRSYEELKNKQKFQHPKTPETDEQSAAERPAGTLSYKSHATAGTWPRDVAFLTPSSTVLAFFGRFFGGGFA